ncbi:hypothetical protein [Mucilaginibacter segetis]|uniref:Uncharacterized protein n=1 Tax=Mucilaginibacter segetis TaxID=2793071 RepID=A0A934UN65_9SPHI|nr:hypothetical protein [Mucilaginibacter segetis]MBK0379735.1 hypothetical protein [Mucilaginibacter segetis]
MKQESLELVILFKEDSLHSKNLLEYFDKEVNDVFDIKFDEISYSLKVKSAMRGKTLKYKEANIVKFISELPNNFNGGGFELLSYLPNFKYKSVDVRLSVSYSPNLYDRRSFITITLNKDFFYACINNNKLIAFYVRVIAFLKSLDKKITYGFIFCMANEKFPAFFAVGTGNYNLTKEEQSELQIWAERMSESDGKIWRVFWGNLITTKHLTAGASIAKIKEIVGNENLYQIDDRTSFFNLPDNNIAYGYEKKKIKGKLRNLVNSLT